MNFYRPLRILLLTLVVAGCGNKVEPPPMPSIPTMPAPTFEMKDLSGKEFSSNSLLGKIVVVNFWATWCPGSVREIPEWVALQNEYETRGVTFIGINVDREGVVVAKPFVDKHGINYPVLMGDMDSGAGFGELDSIPTTFIIDRDWNLINRYTGMASAAAIRSEIHALLQLDRQRALSAGTKSSPSASAPVEGGQPAPYAPAAETIKETVPIPEKPAEEKGVAAPGEVKTEGATVEAIQPAVEEKAEPPAAQKETAPVVVPEASGQTESSDGLPVK